LKKRVQGYYQSERLYAILRLNAEDIVDKSDAFHFISHPAGRLHPYLNVLILDEQVIETLTSQT